MKKLLAMVLALVMTLSLAVSANAAFKDVKDIDETYAESAAVLNGLGVFKGYEEKDGTFSFQPKNAITRAEVAAIVYRIYTGDVKDAYVKNYETYNKFSDMAGAGWAKGYIGYCANAALVKGYPNGTFVPSGKVTGYEVLAMILRAVGYDQKNEFTGADWALHVAEIAERQGILDNVKGVDLNAPATREVVAELLFQSINVPMVTYTAAFGYQNVGLNEKADNKLFAKNETLGSKNFELDCVTGYVTANDYGTKFKNMQIKGENLAEKEKTVKVADQDIFDAGRYGHVWTSKGSVITDVFYDDSLLATSYAGTSIETLTSKKTGNSDYVADLAKENMVVYNGNETVAPTIFKGTEVAMYSIDGKTISSIIVVNPIVDRMEADYVVKGDEVKIQGVKYDKDEVSGYEDLVKGDVFTFVDMADGVRYYEELAPINGQKTKYTIPTKGDAYITFADKDYEESGLSPDKQGSVSFRDTANLFSKDRTTFDKDATIYLDRGGYVAYTLATADVAKYAMVIDSYSVLGEKHNTIEYYVNLLLTDGTETGYVLVDEDCVGDERDSGLRFPNFYEVKYSKNTYIGQPAATGNYIDLGVLVEYTVKDNVYTIKAFDECDDEYLDGDYTKGSAAMDFYRFSRKAVIEDTVAFYFYGTPNSTNFEQTPSKKVDVHYGVNTGKYNKDTNEAGIPSYADGTDVRYLEASGNNKIVDAVVFAGMPMGEYEDFVYLFKCEKMTWTSGVGQLYTYYGVNSAGEVKEFESYNEGREGTVCYYFLRNDKTYDFAPAPYETDLVSVELLGDKDTVEYRYEGKNTKSRIYSNLDKVYDLTDTSDLKAGDKAETYDWKWQTTKVVEGMLVIDRKDGDVECLFVLDDDVTFGEFKINGANYWYPVANYNGTKLVERALADLDGGDFKADKYYHIDGAAAIKGDAGFKFEAGKTYNVVECKDVVDPTVMVNGKAATKVSGKDEYTIELDAHETVTAVTVNGVDALADYTADGKVTVTSEDEVCTKDYTITVTNAKCDQLDVSFYQNGAEDVNGNPVKYTFTLQVDNQYQTVLVKLGNENEVTIQNLANLLFVSHNNTPCDEGKIVFWNSDNKNVIDPAKYDENILVAGKKGFGFTVIAGNGDTADYTINVIVG